MIPLVELWMPIVVAAVLVFIASSIAHMVLPLHKSDYDRLPNEDDVLATLRASDLTPGTYHFPYCTSMQDLGSEEMLAKFNQGPVGFLIVRPKGPPTMGSALLAWFLYCILIGIFAGYVAAVALPRGAEYLQVFRFTGTVAILAYATASIPESIWKGQRWSTTCKFIGEGVVYGLLTAGTFAWLWPAA